MGASHTNGSPRLLVGQLPVTLNTLLVEAVPAARLGRSLIHVGTYAPNRN